MDSLHRPVLLEQVLQSLAPVAGKVILDLTLGGGGYSRAILESGAAVFAFDQDPRSIVRAREIFAPYEKKFCPIHRDFGHFGEELDARGINLVDGICMDLGLSSDQLEDSCRGFSFRVEEGLLDLRFDDERGLPAWERLRDASYPTILSWLRDLGEVRKAAPIARRLKSAADAGELKTTTQLRRILEEILPRHKSPEGEMARVWQALRILVNDELDQLDLALKQVPSRLAAGGRFVAVSYHSLEDRRVKAMLRQESGKIGVNRNRPLPQEPVVRMKMLHQRVIRPAEEEIRENPRARSARLRAGERLP